MISEMASTLAALMGRYVRASVDERATLAVAYPDIFHHDLCATLDAEIADMQNTRTHVKVACQTVDHVAHVLSGLSYSRSGNEYGQVTCAPDSSAGVGVLPLLNNERASVLDDDVLARAFECNLTSLLAQANGKAISSKANHDVSSDSAHRTLPVPASTRPSVVTLNRLQQDQQHYCKWSCRQAATTSWDQDVQLFLEIASYLPSEDVLMHIENVCARWQRWLYEQSISRHFWLGCMHREFQAHLRTLLGNKDALSELVLEGDWRTVVMMCLTADGGDISESRMDYNEEGDDANGR